MDNWEKRLNISIVLLLVLRGLHYVPGIILKLPDPLVFGLFLLSNLALIALCVCFILKFFLIIKKIRTKAPQSIHQLSLWLIAGIVFFLVIGSNDFFVLTSMPGQTSINHYSVTLNPRTEHSGSIISLVSIAGLMIVGGLLTANRKMKFFTSATIVYTIIIILFMLSSYFFSNHTCKWFQLDPVQNDSNNCTIGLLGVSVDSLVENYLPLLRDFTLIAVNLFLLRTGQNKS